MKSHLWNILGYIGAAFVGLMAVVGVNALADKALAPKRPRVSEQMILDHMRVGAFFTEGEHYGSDPDGLPGQMLFPTLYLRVEIEADRRVRLRQDGYGWEPVEGKLRDAILYAYNEKVWG